MTRYVLGLGLPVILAGALHAQFSYGSGPTLATGRIEGTKVTIRQKSGAAPVTMKSLALRKGPGGETVQVEVPLTIQYYNETTVTFDVDNLEAMDVEGKPIEVTRLRQLLAKDAPVVLLQKQPGIAPDLQLLKVFKQDIPIVLVPFLQEGGHGAYVPRPPTIEERKPDKPSKDLPKPSDKDK